MELKTIGDVQQCVGKLPAPRDLKVIDHIDSHAERWLSYASLGFLAFDGKSPLDLTLAGGTEGFVVVRDAHHLSLPLSALDDDRVVDSATAFGALLLVRGMDETLRVNGKVLAIENESLILRVEECYLHCAKAFRRSGFWRADLSAKAYGNVSDLIRRSSFLVLATMNQFGQLDVSPKGDPAGLLIQQHDEANDDVFTFAERPGNRRIDSFRNILERPYVNLLALVPGESQLLQLRGRAVLCTDNDLMQAFSVKGKLPKLVVKIHADSLEIVNSRTISESKLWPADAAPADLKPAEIFKAHIKHSNDRSLSAKVARAAVSIPGAFDKGLASDYKNNMY